MDDAAAAEQRVAVLDAAFRGRDHEGGVLVGAGLHREVMVEQALLRPFLGLLRIHRGRVVAEHDHLDALQPHHPVGLGPAAVVAHRHAEDAAHGAPHREAEIARLEIALLQVLERPLGIELGMAGQVHLAVLADDLAVAVDQDRGVVVVPVGGQLGVAEIEADLVLRPPSRTAAGSRRSASRARTIASTSAWSVMYQRGKKVVSASSVNTTKFTPSRVRLVEQIAQALHHGLARLGLLDRDPTGRQRL